MFLFYLWAILCRNGCGYYTFPVNPGILPLFMLIQLASICWDINIGWYNDWRSAIYIILAWSGLALGLGELDLDTEFGSDTLSWTGDSTFSSGCSAMVILNNSTNNFVKIPIIILLNWLLSDFRDWLILLLWGFLIRDLDLLEQQADALTNILCKYINIISLLLELPSNPCSS